MLETLVAQRNKTYPGFVADRGRETKGVLWAPLPSIILMGPSRVRRTWSCDSWDVSSEASFPCLWPSMEGLVFQGRLRTLQGRPTGLSHSQCGWDTRARALGSHQCSVRLVSWSAVGPLHRPGIDWIGDSGKPQ